MKRWAVLTVILYVLLLVALTVPVILICFGDWWLGKNRGIGSEAALAAYQELGYWLWLALLALGQALFLFAVFGELAWTDAAHDLIRNQILKTSVGPSPATLDYVLGTVSVFTTLWLFWALVFYLFARNDDPNSLVK